MRMRTLSAVLTLALAMAVGPNLWADEKANQDREGTAIVVVERIHDLNLTDEQEAKIADIRKECRPKVQEAAKELAGLVKEEEGKVRGVLTPEQREKVQALRELHKEHRFDSLAARVAHLEQLDLTDAEVAQIAEIRKECRPKIMKAMGGLKGVLTDEQRRAREEALKAGKTHREVRASLNLTDEQKQKMEAVGQEIRPLVREEMDKIRDVLTEEQRQKLAELRDERRDRVRDRMAGAVAHSRDLNLTDEQKAQIADIRKEFRPKIHEAGNTLRAAIREEMGMILAVIKG
jgi:Spy/CpxP family protein refolding chaperone